MQQINAPWHARLLDTLGAMASRDRADTINDIADLALAAPEAEVDAHLDSTSDWLAYRTEATRLYYAHIVAMETQEVARLLAPGAPKVGRYPDLASEKGLISYQRVADMFDHVDFGGCRQFAMVGCGQLPVTAMHVMDRTGIEDMVLLDISGEAIRAVNALRDTFGWSALKPRLCSGKDFDFSQASIVYVGNMVMPKLDTIDRVLATAPDDVQIILREPYSLGRLWAEKAESHIASRVDIVGRGPVSRHLSRDLYLRKRGCAP